MLAKLVANSVVTQAGSNARMCDMVKLLIGTITDTAGLNATVWDVANCYINATIPGNWSLLYQNIGTNINTPGTSATWQIYLSKPAIDTPSKNIQFSIDSTALASIYFSAGLLTAAGAQTTVCPATPAASSNLPLQLNVSGATFVVSSQSSSAVIYSLYSNNIHFCVEKPAAIYDVNTNEALGVVGYISSANAVNGGYVYNMLNLSTRVYIPQAILNTNFYCNWQLDTIGMSRAADKSLLSPMIPLYVEGYATGWIGGSITAKSGLYRLADLAGAVWDTISRSGVVYRIISVGNLRYALIDG